MLEKALIALLTFLTIAAFIAAVVARILQKELDLSWLFLLFSFLAIYWSMFRKRN